MRCVAAPATASMPTLIGAPLTAAVTRAARSGPSISTTSPPSSCSSATISGRTHDVDGAHAFQLREPDQVTAATRVRGVLDQPVAGRELGEIIQQHLGRRAVHRQQRQLDRVALGRRQAAGRLAAHFLTERAGGQRREDAIANLELRDGGTDAHDVGRCPRTPVSAAERELEVGITFDGAQVRDVQRGRLHPDDDFIGCPAFRPEHRRCAGRCAGYRRSPG